MRTRAAMGVALGIAAAAIWATVAAGSHTPTLLERSSAGEINGNGAYEAIFRGASDDGRHVFFTTFEQLVSEDADAYLDVYDRFNGSTSLVSAGEINGNGEFSASYTGSSADGSMVFFTTTEQLTTADTDTTIDLYRRAAGATTLISAGPPSNASVIMNVPFFGGTTPDGARVYFNTTHQLTTDDTNSAVDVYEWAGGTVTRISPGTGAHAEFSAVTDDGSRVFLRTGRSYDSGDTDGANDIYMREGGTITWISVANAGAPGGQDVVFKGMSEDGSHVFWDTQERQVSEDPDNTWDVYERSGGVTTWVSQPAGSGGFDGGAFFRDVSADGTRVFFYTDVRMVPEDTDNAPDIYERSGGTTTLISTGPQSVFPNNGAVFGAASSDGTRVVWRTNERLTSNDTDGSPDVYERANGVTTLLTPDPDPTIDPGALFSGASEDGSRVFIQSADQYVAGDIDGAEDVYEYHQGTLSLVSAGQIDGPGHHHSTWAGATPDGTRVFFHTDEQLVAGDTDSARDVYNAGVGFPYVRPKAASPLTVSLVPAYVACTAPNRVHGPPLEHDSCAAPDQASAHLTVGTPDVDGSAANSTGFLRLTAVVGFPGPPPDSDVNIASSLADVRCTPSVSTCGSANVSGGNDYTGQLEAEVTLRLTDKLNGPTGAETGTVADSPFPVTLSCAETSSSIGASCSVSTSLNALVPGAVVDGARAIMSVGQVRVMDGGPDGDPATADGETLFAVQGIFIP